MKRTSMNAISGMKFFAIFSLLAHFGFSNVLAHEISFEEDSNLPIVNLNIAIKAGSTTDPEGKAGLTRFLGFMLLRGTQTKTKDQIDRTLDQMGAKLEVETRVEALILRGAVLSDQLDKYLSLMQEILTQPKFSQAEIDKLKKETLGLLKEELGHDAELGGRAFNQFLFENHPYGKPILGTESGVHGISREDLLAHEKRLVRDSLILVVGSGDTTKDKISKWAKTVAHLRPDTPLSEHDRKLISIAPVPKNAPQTKIQIVDKPDRTQTQIFIGQIGSRMTDPSFFPLHIGNHAFGGHSFLSTLMSEIREKRGWSYGAYSFFKEGLRPRSWTIRLYPAEKDTPPALAYTLKLLSELKANGLGSKQFNFAKQGMINNAAFMYSTPQKRIENTLLERTLDLPEGFMKSYATRLANVTLEETNAALKNFLKPDHLVVTVVGTASTLREPLAKALDVPVETIQIKPYTEN